MFTAIDWQKFFDLLLQVTKKEFMVRYKHTLFGFFWVIANPLLQMVVIGSVFRFFVKEPIKNYYLFLLVGLHMWNFFSLSLSKVTPSIVFERSLIKKAKFPHLVIPLSITLSNFIHFLIGLVLFIIPIIFLGLTTWSRLPFLLLSLFLLLAFTIGFSLLTCALNVQFRDINFLVQALLVVWFYATPVVYSTAVIPSNLLWLWWLNPLTAVTQLLQYSLVGGEFPPVNILITNLLLIFLFLISGIYVFTKLSKNFDDWI